MSYKIYAGTMFSIIFMLFLSATGCNLGGASEKITVQITNNRDATVRFLAGGSDFLTWDPDFNRYVLPADITTADVNVEIPSGEKKSFTLKPDSNNSATKDWFVQEKTILDDWAPQASENNPDINDYQFLTGHTYTMTVINGVIIPDDLHFDIE